MVDNSRRERWRNMSLCDAIYLPMQMRYVPSAREMDDGEFRLWRKRYVTLGDVKNKTPT